MATEPPKLYQHLLSLYKLLADEAEDGVWEGSQAVIFRELELSHSYNAILFRGLRELDAVEVLRQGHGKVPTRLRLLGKPQLDSFHVWNETKNDKPLTRRPTLASIEARLANIEGRLPSISLTDWIVGIEDRLSVLEKERDGT